MTQTQQQIEPVSNWQTKLKTTELFCAMVNRLKDLGGFPLASDSESHE